MGGFAVDSEVAVTEEPIFLGVKLRPRYARGLLHHWNLVA